MRPTLLAFVGILSLASPVFAEISWRHDVRAAYEEAEDRGVALFIYLTRDD